MIFEDNCEATISGPVDDFKFKHFLDILEGWPVTKKASRKKEKEEIIKEISSHWHVSSLQNTNSSSINY